MALRQFETGDGAVVARPTGDGRFQAEISLRGGPIFADEPIEVGGTATGPTPYELLSAALAACTAMTLRLYAGRKGWDLPPLAVEVAHSLVPGDPPRDRFTRQIMFEGAVDAERQARLIEMADRCPVHRTLLGGFEIVTDIVPPTAARLAEPPDDHLREMEIACDS